MADTEEHIDTPIDDITADIRAAADQAAQKTLAEKVVTTEVDIPNETPQQKADRLRDETGRFIANKSEAQTPATAKPITDADPAQGNVVVPSTAPDIPKTWSAEAKTEWLKLPPAVQQAVLKRETEIDAGGRQWSDEKRQFQQALGPVQELAQQYQMPLHDVAARLVNVERRLGNPQTAPQVIAELASSYGVDLAALVNGSPQPQRQAPQFDPNTIPSIVEERLQAWQQEQAVNSQIQTFAAERDDAGQLKHPHFQNESVKQHMSALLDKGLASDLQDAYDKSVWALPDVRTTMIAAQQPKVVPNKDQVIKAKRAAVSPSGAPNGSVPAKSPGADPKASIEDDIRESIASLRH